MLEPADGHPLPEIVPGQYVSVFVDLPDGDRQPRQYTVSSTAVGTRLQITVRRVLGKNGAPNGRVSTYLHNQAKVGDILDVSAPAGDFVPTPSNSPLLLAATLTPPPAGLGVTHWSSRLLADHLGVDASAVLRTWRHHRVQPWRVETFKFLYRSRAGRQGHRCGRARSEPTENAIVLSIDEKSQIQALNRTQKQVHPAFGPHRRQRPGHRSGRTIGSGGGRVWRFRGIVHSCRRAAGYPESDMNGWRDS